ncbi:RloB domain-containing protein [Bradyrhizobium liaoningense]|nr:RloB domain-containing protein [Bradyrhizobium liaoningense]
MDGVARHYRSLVAIDLIIEKGAGVPLSILRRAREILANRDHDFGQNDQVWAVFDRDDHPEVARAISEAIASGIRVGFSNPCFELWLVLHYRDFDAPVTRTQIQRVLRDLMPKYNPRRSKEISFSEICDAVESAEARAEAMDRRRVHERNERGNPCSTIYKLTREIRRHGKE